MIGGKMIRRGLKTSNWQRATQTINEAEARGTWEAPEAPPQSQGPTIEEAIEKFLLDARSRLRPPTVKKYEVLLKRARGSRRQAASIRPSTPPRYRNLP